LRYHLTLLAVASAFVAGLSTSDALAAPVDLDHAATKACVCPYYIYDDGPRKDGSFGARSYYTTLSLGTPGYFIVRIHGYELTRKRLNDVEVFFDVNKADPGPEYRFADWLTADHDGHSERFVAKVDTWNDPGSLVSCPKWATSVDYAHNVVTSTIPRRCIGSPAHVRWNTETWHFARYDPDGSVHGFVDGVQGYQEFAGFWTGRGQPFTCGAMPTRPAALTKAAPPTARPLVAPPAR
jgi:hypothetical protein